MVKNTPALFAAVEAIAHKITESKVPIQSIAATLMLSRNPVVTKELTEFEKNYYYYQSELQRRLMWTFPKYFYYKKGTIAEEQFAALQTHPVSKQDGVFFPKGEPVIRHNRDLRFKQVVNLPKSYDTKAVDAQYGDDDMSRPVTFNPRVTKSDETNDRKSLERRLSRTLYLLVKQNQWKFPSFQLNPEKELPLHAAAQEGILELGGECMNLWHVSNTPSHVLKFSGDKIVPHHTKSESLTREYFMKSHIISGKFDPAPEVEYLWLTKEEIPEYVSSEYYQNIEHLLESN